MSFHYQHVWLVLDEIYAALGGKKRHGKDGVEDEPQLLFNAKGLQGYLQDGAYRALEMVAPVYNLMRGRYLLRKALETVFEDMKLVAPLRLPWLFMQNSL
jgi:hypothetical protein